MKLKTKNMDSVTYNKLEYITSGSGLTPTELNEIVDLMDEYAREHANIVLCKPRGRIVSVIVGEDVKDPDLKAIYLINEALELSTPRMVRSNLEFVFGSKRWSNKYNLKLNK